MIDWFTPRMTGHEAAAVAAVLDSGYVNDGPITRKFEKQIAELCDRRHAVAVPSGTVALSLALLACGAKAGDDIIVPDLTFIATANAARMIGCNVILCDVEYDDFCLSAKTVEVVRTAKTKFVIAVEVNGRQPNYNNLDGLSAYCKSYNITLITDSCESLGSGKCGSFGKASCLSFSPNKLITTGQGGMVLTNDPAVDKRLQQLKYQGMDERGSGGNDRHSTLGFNFKFNDILAAVGLEQLRALPARIERARQRDRWYADALAGYDIEMPGPQEGGVCLWTDVLAIEHQHSFAGYLRNKGVNLREFWYPLHRQIPYAFDREFPVASSISNRGIWLPSSYDITQDQVGQVADAIKARYKRAA